MADIAYHLINDDQLAGPLAHFALVRGFLRSPIVYAMTRAYVDECKVRYQDTGLLDIDFSRVRACLEQDHEDWRLRVKTQYKKRYRSLANHISQNLDVFSAPQKALLPNLLHAGINAKKNPLGLSQSLANHVVPVTRWQISDIAAPLVINNIINNEHILRLRMQQQRPFWFVDSGYTNFLIKHKTWLRLIRDGVHHNPDMTQSYPADRLRHLPCFPTPWRQEGRDILVVESSESHHSMFGTNMNVWRERVRDSLHRHTNRKILFHPKIGNRKNRRTVYEMLQQDPDRWYCVVTDCSAASIEAIWCGIPAITMRDHITHPVTRTNLSSINDLYRGPLGDWLCALTYNQFTLQEIASGQALAMLRRYNNA